MIKMHYLREIFKTYRALHIFAIFLVGGLQFLIIMLVASSDVLDFIETMYSQFPPLVQQLFSEQFIGQFSISGIAAFGYRHPLVLSMIMIVAVLVPTRFMSGDIETGRMELLLALPVRRSVLFMTLWTAIAVLLFSIVAGAWCGTFLAAWRYPEAQVVPWGGVIRIGLNLWLLSLCVAAYCLLIASFMHEYGRAALLSAGITVGIFFLNYITAIWDKIAFMAPLSPVYYFSPQHVLSGTGTFYRNILVLGSLVCMFLSIALYRFIHRDIPG